MTATRRAMEARTWDRATHRASRRRRRRRRHRPRARPLGRVRRRSPSWSSSLDQLTQGLARRDRRARARSCRSSATALRLVHEPELRRPVRDVPRPGARSSGSSRSASSALIVAYHATGGPEPLPVDRARAAARRRHRQPDRPPPARLRRRLRRHGHRRPALLHLQRRRRGDQPSRSSCSSALALVPGLAQRLGGGGRMPEARRRSPASGPCASRTGRRAAWTGSSPTRPGCRGATSRSSSPTGA